MSLTQFIRRPEVSKLFGALDVERFKPPARTILAPPITKSPQRVGTAFDYLLRFFVKFHNPHALGKTWVAENSKYYFTLPYTESELMSLAHSELERKRIEFRKRQLQAEEYLEDARAFYRAYLRTGLITDDLLMSTLRLAGLDVAVRAGAGKIDWRALENVDPVDIEDLKALIGIVNKDMFATSSGCFLNPYFNYASSMVGGADADVIVGSSIIDIKTTKSISLDKRDIYQVLGYYILALLDGVCAEEKKEIDWRKRYPDSPSFAKSMAQWEYDNSMTRDHYTKAFHEITSIGLYYSRYGYMHKIQISELLPQDQIEQFARVFVRLASTDKRNCIFWWKKFNSHFARNQRNKMKVDNSICNKPRTSQVER